MPIEDVDKRNFGRLGSQVAWGFWVLLFGQVVARGILKNYGCQASLTISLTDQEWEPRWPEEVDDHTRIFAYCTIKRSWKDIPSGKECARLLAGIPRAAARPGKIVESGSIQFGKEKDEERDGDADGLQELSDARPVAETEDAPAIVRAAHDPQAPGNQDTLGVERGVDDSRTGIHLLPVELMDMISIDAIAEGETQDITTTPEPNLSRVSKSLDRESILKIFYSKNRWEVTVLNFEYKVLYPIAELNRKYGPIQLDIYHHLTENHDKLMPRLIRWLKMAFHNRILGLTSWESKTQYEWHVRADRLAHLFNYCRFLRDKRRMRWPAARVHLKWQIKVAGVCNEPGSEWLDG